MRNENGKMDIMMATENDIQRIMDIEREAFSFPWTQGGLVAELNNTNSFFPMAVDNDIIMGFAIIRKTGSDGELLQIAVASEYQRQGAATALIEAVLEWAVTHNVTRVFLEVRVSNEAAKSLYVKFGFVEIGRRKDYYILPTEDALTMERRVAGD